MDPLIERLQVEFADRQAKNPSYSLRAFARDLDLNLTSVRMILNGERRPATRTRRLLTDRLALPPTFAIGETLAAGEVREDDQFRAVSEWVHSAILNLVRPGVKPKTAVDLQKHLDLPASVIHAATERLLRLGQIEKRGTHFIRVIDQLRTKDDIPSSAIRKLHGETLGLAREALTKFPVERREFSTSFMMVRPSHIPKVKELMRKFRVELASIFDPELPAQKDAELHIFSQQLYPLE